MAIIVLEGLDGSGKTGLGLRLAEVLGYVYRHYPVDLEKAKRTNPGKSLDFYMAVDMLMNPPDISQNWVLDRYYHSHTAYGGSYSAFLENGQLPKPDYTFLLAVDPQTSFNRCSSRGDDTDISVDQRKIILERYIKNYTYTSLIPGSFTQSESLMHVINVLRQDLRFNHPLFDCLTTGERLAPEFLLEGVK